jgi:beta-N-acetylhexosaminidase
MAVRQTSANLKAQVGQLLIIGFDGTALTRRLQALLEQVQPAGIILFARNIVNAQQTHKLIGDCRGVLKTPMFCCVDMEGGQVDRLRDVIGPTPSAADVFATGDPQLFRRHGELVGQSCRAVGLNVDLAPVVDLAFPISQKVMGSRSVSIDPRQTARYAGKFLAGLRSKGVFGAIKHFPGLGEASLDSHVKLPKINKSWKRLWAEDLAPYRILRQQSPFVLVGHAAYPAVTRPVPASLSKRWISGILRGEMGYSGLVLSDDLEMGGAVQAAPVEEAAVRHIRAGGDLCLICHHEEHVIRAFETLQRAVDADAAFRKRAHESVVRVLAFKKRRLEIKRRVRTPTAAKIRALSRKLWEFGEQVRLAGIRRQAGT